MFRGASEYDTFQMINYAKNRLWLLHRRSRLIINPPTTPLFLPHHRIFAYYPRFMRIFGDTTQIILWHLSKS